MTKESKLTPSFSSAYFCEEKQYLFSELKSKFHLDDDDELKKRINLLRRCNILKIVKKEKLDNSDLSDQELIINEPPEDSSEFCYVFSFVGIILLQNFLLKCYPKYINNANEKNDGELFSKLKTVLKVIEKYNSQKNQTISLYNGIESQKTFNRLLISLYILRDYFENGLYTNQKENITQNGDGEILWNRTIDETFAFLKNCAPYYLEPFTKETSDDDFDFVRRLHAAVITECSKYLDNAKILELFDMNGAALTDENISDFGDADYIKYRLEKAIGEEFVTKKQMLLKTLYTYISERKSNENENSFSFYGTNAFNLVWEKACGEVFENMRDLSFRELKQKEIIEDKKIENPNYNLDNSVEKYLKNFEPLKNLIEKIKWTFNDFAVHAAETLEPDIITIQGRNFYILDAKYYLIEIDDDKICHQPGIQDVVKQFAYHKAFFDFINNFGFSKVVNAFLVPKKSSDNLPQNFAKIGEASLDFMQIQNYAFKTKLPPIQIVKLSPDFVYKNYLSGSKITKELSELLEKKNDVVYSEKNEKFLKVAETPMNKAAQTFIDANSNATYSITHKF